MDNWAELTREEALTAVRLGGEVRVTWLARRQDARVVLEGWIQWTDDWGVRVKSRDGKSYLHIAWKDVQTFTCEPRKPKRSRNPRPSRTDWAVMPEDEDAGI